MDLSAIFQPYSSALWSWETLFGSSSYIPWEKNFLKGLLGDFFFTLFCFPYYLTSIWKYKRSSTASAIDCRGSQECQLSLVHWLQSFLEKTDVSKFMYLLVDCTAMFWTISGNFSWFKPQMESILTRATLVIIPLNQKVGSNWPGEVGKNDKQFPIFYSSVLTFLTFNYVSCPVVCHCTSHKGQCIF